MQCCRKARRIWWLHNKVALRITRDITVARWPIGCCYVLCFSFTLCFQIPTFYTSLSARPQNLALYIPIPLQRKAPLYDVIARYNTQYLQGCQMTL